MEVFFYQNTNKLTLKGLHRRNASGVKTFVNDATCTFEVLDEDRQPLDPAVSGPMNYEAQTDGIYAGGVGASAALAIAQSYKVKIVAEQGGSTATWYMPVIVKEREG